MARPSQAEVREREELERAQNVDFLKQLRTEGIDLDHPGIVTTALIVLDAIAKWWSEESIRLESSTKRSDAATKKDYRVATRCAQARAESLRKLNLADLVDVSQPEPECCGDASSGPGIGDPLTCVRSPGHDGQHHDGVGHSWLADTAPEPAPAPVPDDVVAYLSGDDTPPAPETPSEPVPIAETEIPAVFDPSMFVDPAPIEEPSPVVAFVDPASIGGRRLSWFDLAQPIDRPPTSRLSVSQLTEYEGCGLRYRLASRTDGVSCRPMWSGVGGSAVHAAVEEIERVAAYADGAASWSSIVKTFEVPGPPGDPLETLWRRHLHAEMSKRAADSPAWPMNRWHAAAKGSEHYTWWLANGAAMLRRYVTMRESWDQEWGILQVDGRPVLELKHECIIAGYRFIVVIDQAWVHRTTGEVRIRDIKTGASHQGDNTQLKVYTLALDSMFGASAPTITGDYWSARDGLSTDPVSPGSPAARAELAYRATAMRTADATGVHMPVRSNWCGACPVRHACPTTG